MARAVRIRRGDLSFLVLEHFIGPGSRVADIGAGWGLYACLCATRVGPKGRVLAFEPNPRNAGSLTRLVRRHSNLTFHPTALSDRSGRAELHVPVEAWGREVWALGSLSPSSARPRATEKAKSVPIDTLDKVLDGLGLSVDFIKCDVEGHELAVLKGAERTLLESRPIVLIEIEQRHQDGDIEATFEYLLSHGYEGMCIRDSGLDPLANFSVRRDQLDYLSETMWPDALPKEYVYEFLFTPEGTDVTGVSASSRASRDSGA